METVYAAELGCTTDLVSYNKLFSSLVTILSWLDPMVQLSGARKLSDAVRNTVQAVKAIAQSKVLAIVSLSDTGNALCTN
jgi:hypothetical protein